MNPSFQHGIRSINKLLAISLMFFIPISTTLTQVVMGLILFTWFFTGNIKEKINLSFKHPITRIACLLFLVFLLGMTYTVAPWREALAQLGKMSKVLYLVFLIPIFSNPKLRKRGLFAFILAMTVTLILALLRIYGDLSIPTRYQDAAIFKNHIDTNLMMSLAIFLIGNEWITTAQKRKPWGIILLFTMISMTFYCLWMSKGRTGYVTFMLLWAIFCIQRLSVKMALTGIGLLAIIIGLIINAPSELQPHLQSRLKNISKEIELHDQNSETSVGQRLEYLSHSLLLIQQRPLLGWGTGSFSSAYEKEILHKNPKKVANPHNEYLNLLVQWGVLGLGGFLILLGTIFKLSFRLPIPERYTIQGILAIMVVGSLANSLLMDITSGYLFVTITALCLGAYPIQARTPASLSAAHSPEKNLFSEAR